MKLSQLALAAAVAGGVASAQAADLGVLDLTSGSGFFGNTPASGTFTDTLTFTLPILSTVSGSLVSVVNGSQDVDFTSVSLARTGGGGSASFSRLFADPVEVWALPAAGASLAAGTYTLTLTGSNSNSVGSYAGNIAVTPVPEPQSLALMLAGIGAVGMLVRRRRP